MGALFLFLFAFSFENFQSFAYSTKPTLQFPSILPLLPTPFYAPPSHGQHSHYKPPPSGYQSRPPPPHFLKSPPPPSRVPFHPRLPTPSPPKTSPMPPSKPTPSPHITPRSPPRLPPSPLPHPSPDTHVSPPSHLGDLKVVVTGKVFCDACGHKHVVDMVPLQGARLSLVCGGRMLSYGYSNMDGVFHIMINGLKYLNLNNSSCVATITKTSHVSKCPIPSEYNNGTKGGRLYFKSYNSKEVLLGAGPFTYVPLNALRKCVGLAPNKPTPIHFMQSPPPPLHITLGPPPPHSIPSPTSSSQFHPLHF